MASTPLQTRIHGRISTRYNDELVLKMKFIFTIRRRSALGPGSMHYASSKRLLPQWNLRFLSKSTSLSASNICVCVCAYFTLPVSHSRYPSGYCTISINSAGGVTCDALAEFFTPAKSRVDKGQGQISARGNIRPPMPEHNVGTPVSKDLWRSAPMKDHDPKCWKGEILTKKGCAICRNT